MPDMHSSGLVKRVARQNSVTSLKESRSGWRDKRDVGQEKLTLVPRANSAKVSYVIDAMPSSMAVCRQKAAAGRSSVIGVLLEGFAMYGASVYPTAYFPVAPHSDQEKYLKPRDISPRKRREPISPVSPKARHGKVPPELERHSDQASYTGSEVAFANDSLGELNDVELPHIGRANRWSWLTLAWEVVVTLWTYVRREREIRRAVAALAKFDDRTLRDIGIPHRSRIEQVIRYCHDC